MDFPKRFEWTRRHSLSEVVEWGEAGRGQLSGFGLEMCCFLAFVRAIGTPVQFGRTETTGGTKLTGDSRHPPLLVVWPPLWLALFSRRI